MLPEIVPIIATNIDWNKFMSGCQSATGRSVTTKLDALGIKPNSLKAFVATLGTLRDANADINKIFQNPGALLNHGFYGFLVICSNQTHTDLLEDSGLNVVSTDTLDRQVKLCLVTGTLTQWRTAVINGCSSHASFDYRLFSDKCLLHFESIGLGSFWSDYSKKTLSDSSFELVAR